MSIEQVVDILFNVEPTGFKDFFAAAFVVKGIVHLVADFAKFFGIADPPAIGADFFNGQSLTTFIQRLKIFNVAAKIIFGVGAGYNFGQVVDDFLFFDAGRL